MSAPIPALWELATLHGVLPSYEDGEGTVQRAEAAVVLALLRALGVPLDDPAEAPAFVHAERARLLARPFEPVLVHRTGRDATVAATLPGTVDPDGLWLSVELEGGITERARAADVLVRTTGSSESDGRRYEHVRLDLERALGQLVPPGRHRVTLEGAGLLATALLLSAPACPEAGRQVGAFMPLHALRSAGDWGIGSYPDLGRLAGWAGARGCDFVGTLPLYPAFLDPPADPSPYLPASRLAYNEVYVDPRALPEFAASSEARQACAGSAFGARLDAVRSSTLVDYEEVARLKRSVLEMLARVADDGALPRRREEMETFLRLHPELEAYARFRAQPEPLGTDGRSSEAYHRYAQWAAFQQLVDAGRAGGRYADLPIGSHPDGFDPAWSPDSFVPDVHGGAPPDRFFPGGQDWGFRPLHPERMRDDGYAFFSACLRRAFEHADCLRIDHIMGLQRLYMIPEGGCEGAYVSYRAEELHALVALEAHRSGTVVVGEDLGTVPEEVRPRMERDNILRTWVFQFESTAERPLPPPPAGSLVALGTHDLPRFGAYVWGEDVAERQESGILSAGEATTESHRRVQWRERLFEELGLSQTGSSEEKLTAAALEGCLLRLSESSAAILMVDLEELWGERGQENVPGSGPGGRNWRRRSARTLEEIESDRGMASLFDEIARERHA